MFLLSDFDNIIFLIKLSFSDLQQLFKLVLLKHILIDAQGHEHSYSKHQVRSKSIDMTE